MDFQCMSFCVCLSVIEHSHQGSSLLYRVPVLYSCLWPHHVPSHLQTASYLQSADGHLSCFHFLATVNNTATSICEQDFGGHIFSLILGEPLVRAFLGCVIYSVYNFLRNEQPFLKSGEEYVRRRLNIFTSVEET